MTEEVEGWASYQRHLVAEYKKRANRVSTQTERDVSMALAKVERKLNGIEGKVKIVTSADWSKSDHQKEKAYRQVGKAWPKVQEAYDELLHAAFQLEPP